MYLLTATTLTATLLTTPTAVATDWITECQFGTYRDRASNALSSGKLETGLCSYSTKAVSQVNIRYAKARGATVTLRFAWEFVNKRGTVLTGTRHDLGKFRQSAGETRYYAWKYPFPGTPRPAAPLTCGRGVMVAYDDQGGTVAGRFETGVICW
ncbi:hypothetical protein F1D05_16355 [Kribbella qitaiheensis]|uniref:Uncharacterized protein n=1 Tax=Kribbella qitaiheensis TaxID=1544730 RepID=A0A7G6WYY4_9ACTN|nr:hypothetical protein [Kribbella qitaiheensis]QNE19199.1 hypothetical protein F1D05_16355 [Kribbella qitaiheensis]